MFYYMYSQFYPGSYSSMSSTIHENHIKYVNCVPLFLSGYIKGFPDSTGDLINKNVGTNRCVWFKGVSGLKGSSLKEFRCTLHTNVNECLKLR